MFRTCWEIDGGFIRRCLVGEVLAKSFSKGENGIKSIKQPAHDTDLDFQLRLLSEEQERSKAEYWELQKAAEWSPCQQFVLSLS
jgi:hypothetical protein